MPPWPGIVAAISLVPMSRLITLMERSPSCPPIPTISPARINCHAPKNGNENRKAQGRIIATTNAPTAPSQVLLGLISLRNGCLPKIFPKRERRDGADRGRKDNEADKAIGVARIRQKSEVTKHPADINESDNRERHSLQFSARPIAQNRNHQDKGDGKDRHCDKESIPPGALLLATWM